MGAWFKKAKCLGEPLENYVLDEGEGYQRPPDRAKKARSLCEGCPVIQDCAIDAIDHSDEGVVRAGIWIPSGNNRNASNKVKRYLSSLRWGV